MVVRNKYKTMVQALFAEPKGVDPMLLHAAVGISGEAGEILEIAKKHWVHGKPLDREALVEEMGDVEFYLEALRQHIGITRDECLESNYKKLARRFPGLVYSRERAIRRADKEGS